jgi:hypothetical protein
LFALGYAAAFVACALPGGLSGGAAPSTEGDGGGEGGPASSGTGTPESGTTPTDAATMPLDADATTDADAGAPLTNLAANGDFTLGCAGWTTTEGTSSSFANGRSGSACQVCATGPDLDFSQTIPFTTAPNQQYYGEVWVRAPVDTGPPIGLSVINEFANGGNEDPVTTTGPAATTTWTKVTALLTTQADGVGVSLDITLTGVSGHCVVLDDAVVTRLK